MAAWVVECLRGLEFMYSKVFTIIFWRDFFGSFFEYTLRHDFLFFTNYVSFSFVPGNKIRSPLPGPWFVVYFMVLL